MVLGFEGLFLPAAILAAVAAGTVWMAAGAALGLGSISVLGVGFTAALLGMGVDYGILGSSRFRDLRLRGEGVAAALAATFRETGPGVATTAVTTAAGLAALSVAHFRLLRELGQVLSLGVIATLVATATVCAALLAGFPAASARFRPLRLWPRFGRPVLAGHRRRCRPGAGAPPSPSRSCSPRWPAGGSRAWSSPPTSGPCGRPTRRRREAERLLVQKFSVGLDTFSVVLRGRTLGEALDRAAAARRSWRRAWGRGRRSPPPPTGWCEGEPAPAAPGGAPRPAAGAGGGRLPARAGGGRLQARPLRPRPGAPCGRWGGGRTRGRPPLAEWPRWMSELVRLEPRRPGGRGRRARAAPPGDGREGRSRGPGPRALARLAPERPGRGPGLHPAGRGASCGTSPCRISRGRASWPWSWSARWCSISFRGRVRDALLAVLPLTLGCLWAFGLWGAPGPPPRPAVRLHRPPAAGHRHDPRGQRRPLEAPAPATAASRRRPRTWGWRSPWRR